MSGIGFKALLKSEVPEASFPVPGLFAEGLTLFGGRPKVGKTWAALNIVVSAAVGEPVFGYFPCRPLNIAYYDLENGAKLIKRRLEQLFPSADQAPDTLDNVTLHDHIRPLKAGGIDDLEEAILSASRAGTPLDLIFIDTIKGVLSGSAKGQTAEHKELLPLHTLGVEYGIAIVGIEHLTKRSGWKTLSEAFGGTNGQTGAAGELMVLDDRSGSVVLRAEGRLLDTKLALAMERRENRMIVTGEAEAVVTAKSQLAILDYLGSVDGPRNLHEISAGTGLSYDTTKKGTYRLRDIDRVNAEDRGQYSLKGTRIPRPEAEALSLRPFVPSVPFANSVPLEDIEPVHLEDIQATDIEEENTSSDIAIVSLLPKRDKGTSSLKGTESQKGTKGTEVIEGTNIDDLTEQHRYFLRWLSGFDGEPSHRNAQQRCSPNLSGDEIKEASSDLARLGFLTIDVEGTGKRKMRLYFLTEKGKSAVAILNHDPNQMTMF